MPSELFHQKSINDSRQRESSKRLSISNSNKTLMKSFPAQKVFKQRLHASMDVQRDHMQNEDPMALAADNELYTTLPDGVSINDLNLEQLYGLLSSILTKQHILDIGTESSPLLKSGRITGHLDKNLSTEESQLSRVKLTETTAENEVQRKMNEI